MLTASKVMPGLLLVQGRRGRQQLQSLLPTPMRTSAFCSSRSCPVPACQGQAAALEKQSFFQGLFPPMVPMSNDSSTPPTLAWGLHGFPTAQLFLTYLLRVAGANPPAAVTVSTRRRRQQKQQPVQAALPRLTPGGGKSTCACADQPSSSCRQEPAFAS